MQCYRQTFPAAEATEAFAEAVLEAWRSLESAPLRLHLCGPLGAGKSTFARALLRRLGVQGKIKSPSYALIEPYSVGNLSLIHADLYRLTDPLELINLGLLEALSDAHLALIEWPEKGGALMPNPDCTLNLTYSAEGDARELAMQATSPLGQKFIAALLAQNRP